MKAYVAVLCFAIATSVGAQRAYNPEYPVDESPKPYSYQYSSELEEGGSSSRTETADGSGNVRGSYTLVDVDGRTRTVEYEAGPEGYRAIVRTNEPGTISHYPADAQYESSAEPVPGALIYSAGAQAYSGAAVRSQATRPAVPAVPAARTQPQRGGGRYVYVPE